MVRPWLTHWVPAQHAESAISERVTHHSETIGFRPTGSHGLIPCDDSPSHQRIALVERQSDLFHTGRYALISVCKLGLDLPSSANRLRSGGLHELPLTSSPMFLQVLAVDFSFSDNALSELLTLALESKARLG
jgi:hypothetical protein